jgi:spoIIIJ-associated protein
MDKESAIVFAKEYLENLLTFFGVNAEISAVCDDEVIELQVPSTHLNGFLIGQHGDTLRSLQFIVSMALRNKDAQLDRVNIDIADYKRHRAERLAQQVREWCEEVLKTKQPMDLRPMNAADRRIVHHAVGEFKELHTESVGEGRERHVIISPESAE